MLGAFALAVPLIASLFLLARKAPGSALARTGFALILALVLYSFGENLEILAYLYWPALILIGKSLAAGRGQPAASSQ